MLPNKKKCYKKLFLDFGLFWPFFNQKTAKIDKKWRKLAKSKPFDEYSVSWYVDASLQKKCYKTFSLDFDLFFPFFNPKTAKIDQNEENGQNPNWLMKFSEIWYVDASQRKKMLRKNFLWISAFFDRFLTKKQQKLTKNEENWQI